MRISPYVKVHLWKADGESSRITFNLVPNSKL